MQRNFVADVSHELRTPLTTLRGNLGLLGRVPPIPQEESADILNDMVDESDRLIRLVNDLLVLARADAGRNLAHEPLEAGPVWEEACRQMQQLDLQRNIHVAMDGGLMVLGDRDALKQIALILLDNAVKHSAGDIIVSGRRMEQAVEMRVKDGGPGIAPERLAHIFDRFYRGEDRTAGGFGLGLSIAKALVEALNGSIMMESELGQGSVVIVRLVGIAES